MDIIKISNQDKMIVENNFQLNFKINQSVLVFAFLFFTATTFGQMSITDIKAGHYGSPEARTLQIDSMMQVGLSLNSDQLPVVHDINLHFSKRVENEVVKQNIGDWTRYRRIMKIQKDKDIELKKVLTETQFEKYEKKRDEMFWDGIKSIF